MSENYESILDAAKRLPMDEQRRLAENLLSEVDNAVTHTAAMRGQARRHFGAWDSGNERSADNEQIDRDLAREYGEARRP